MLRRRRSDKHALQHVTLIKHKMCFSDRRRTHTCLAKTDYLRQLLRVFSELADAVHPCIHPTLLVLLGSWAQWLGNFAECLRAFSLCTSSRCSPFYRDFPLSFPSKFVVSGDRVKGPVHEEKALATCRSSFWANMEEARHEQNKFERVQKRRVSYSCCSTAHFS